MIDEIDLHLHPTWQRRVVSDLQAAFPKIQFIVSTHSPFIVQSADSGAVIDLNQPADPSSVHLSESLATTTAAPGPVKEYTNKSIEDISEDVMGIEQPQRSVRLQKMFEVAKEYYSVLQQAHGADDKKKQELKNKLDELSALYSEDVAYHAFLEQRRLAAGLGNSKRQEGDNASC